MKSLPCQDFDLTEHIKLSEVVSKDGAPFTTEQLKNIIEIAKDVEMVRYFVNHVLLGPEYPELKVFISSGIRSEEHNKAEGGYPTSAHLSGDAIDYYMATEPNTPDTTDQWDKWKDLIHDKVSRYACFFLENRVRQYPWGWHQATETEPERIEIVVVD